MIKTDSKDCIEFYIQSINSETYDGKVFDDDIIPDGHFDDILITIEQRRQLQEAMKNPDFWKRGRCY